MALVGSVLSWPGSMLGGGLCAGGGMSSVWVLGVLVGLLPTTGAVTLAALRRAFGPVAPGGAGLGAAIGVLSCWVLPWLAFDAVGRVFRGARPGGGRYSVGRAPLAGTTCSGLSGRARLGNFPVSAAFDHGIGRAVLFVVPLVVVPAVVAFGVWAQARVALRRGPAWPSRFFGLSILVVAVLSGPLPAGVTAQLWWGVLISSFGGLVVVSMVPPPAWVRNRPAAATRRPAPLSARPRTSPAGPGQASAGKVGARKACPGEAGAVHSGPEKAGAARSATAKVGSVSPGPLEVGSAGSWIAGVLAAGSAHIGTARAGAVAARVGKAGPPRPATAAPAPGAPAIPAQRSAARPVEPAPSARRPGVGARPGGRFRLDAAARADAGAWPGVHARNPGPGVPGRQVGAALLAAKAWAVGALAGAGGARVGWPVSASARLLGRGAAGRPLARDPGPMPAGAAVPRPRPPATLVESLAGPGQRFELVRRLGAGGFGGVWLASDHQHGRWVAVKAAHAPDATTELRIRREARALGAVAHPNCVRILDLVDSGSDPGLAGLRGLVIVMEYVEGQSLGELVTARGSVDDRTAARIWLRSAGALAAAHQRGVLHRDIKPDNVVLDPAGEPHLIDFGIARARGDVTLTLHGVVIGTPDFLAPEIARGERATPASDAWQLAATISFALTGVPPRGDHTEATAGLRAAASGAAPTALPVRSVHRNLLAACLAADPAARPTLAEVRRVLDRWLAGDPPVGAGSRRCVARPRSPGLG